MKKEKKDIEKIYRPSDYSILVKSNNGNYKFEFTHKDSIHTGYSCQYLLDIGFKIVKNESEIRRLHKEYYEYKSWECKSDGHGGFESRGTIEDFRKKEKI